MFDDLVTKISVSSQLDRTEVMRMVEEKQVELSGLISDEGAAYLVAKELGLELKRDAERLNIENVVPGMQNVDVTGKAVRIFPVREFKTEKAEGRVCNVIVADQTGPIRLTLWNEEITKLEGVQIGDVVRIRGYVRDNQGSPEIRLGRRGSIEKTEDVMEDVMNTAKRAMERSSIKDLAEGFARSVRAPILQIFESNVFFETCPECRKRLKDTDEGWLCEAHGVVEPDYGLIISGIIDDGTASVRAVFFTGAAEKILGMAKTDAKKLFDRKKKMEAVLSQIPLGKEFVFEGKLRRNTIFDRTEFVVNDVKEVDVKQEIKTMMGRMGNG